MIASGLRLLVKLSDVVVIIELQRGMKSCSSRRGLTPPAHLVAAERNDDSDPPFLLRLRRRMHVDCSHSSNRRAGQERG